MSADVTTIHRYQAYCIDCGWWSDELESEDAADRDADEHDDENHATHPTADRGGQTEGDV